MLNIDFWRMRFGVEVEALDGPVECPLGRRGTDHGGRVYEYRLGPLTLSDWRAHREELSRFWSQLVVDPSGDPPTGLHVHVEMPPEVRDAGLTEKQFFARLARLWEWCEGPLVVFRNSARSRYASSWDEEFKQKVAGAVREGLYGVNRYHTLNLAAYPEHGTVEFRLWDATSSFEEAEERAVLCLAVVWVAAVGCGERTHRSAVEETRDIVNAGRRALALLRLGMPASSRGTHLRV
ncbi:Putative amidoligase enzyme [Thermanaeromonas toyohensis ToBE]|uniref:Putative amidoligase enzyme n=1 Tax=Thermanaeromonas toyohensis ToBE TaxID=698762 RepID=A0A1W1VSU4_9FIRM|nr:amidoligase family protein [Thermanaeromonas toyohensis]SMB96343.1 Putative amidoligase enzyme [Thermanaeromonas toyohensis ToBE]